MKADVTITCPACQQPLKATVDIIEDVEGDSSVPNGTHRFYSLQDYTIDWTAHNVALLEAAAHNDDMRVPLIGCELVVKTPKIETYQIALYDGRGTRAHEVVTHPLEDKLTDMLSDAGMDAYINGQSDLYDSMAEHYRQVRLELLYD